MSARGAGAPAERPPLPRPCAHHFTQRFGGAAAPVETRTERGRVTEVIGTIVHATVPRAAIGDLCRLVNPLTGATIAAEVVGLTHGVAKLTPIGSTAGLSGATEVETVGRPLDVGVGDTLLGRVLDAFGDPIDGKGALGPLTRRPMNAEPPAALSRALISRPMPTGLRVMDGLLTLGVGQRIGLYGEPGGGKSTLLSQIVRGAAADVAVVALIGERGREVREFVEHSLDAAGLARSVVVAATSDRPPLERVKAMDCATAIAEEWRDRGRDVLLVVDSVTRYARALREVALAAGEPPTRRGFPPSVFAALPRLLERAGPAPKGTITAIYTVLVEGDGTDDPIAEETRGILDGHVILSAELAALNHYPAVDIARSRSRVMPMVVPGAHAADAAQFQAMWTRYAEAEFLIKVGEHKAGNDPATDRAVERIDPMRAFLRQGRNERTGMDAVRSRLRAVVT